MKNLTSVAATGISIVAFALCAIWFFREKTFEPVVTLLLTLAGLLSAEHFHHSRHGPAAISQEKRGALKVPNIQGLRGFFWLLHTSLRLLQLPKATRESPRFALKYGAGASVIVIFGLFSGQLSIGLLAKTTMSDSDSAFLFFFTLSLAFAIPFYLASYMSDAEGSLIFGSVALAMTSLGVALGISAEAILYTFEAPSPFYQSAYRELGGVYGLSLWAAVACLGSKQCRY